MHHRMPPSKTGCPSLKVVIFPPVLSLVLDNRKDIIYQIHELILEDRRISFKSIGEQLSLSRESVGPIIHENLEMLKLSA